MCLACANIGAKTPEEIASLFDFSFLTQIEGFEKLTLDDFKNIPGSKTGNTLHTHDNQRIDLTDKQIKEMVENALVVIATGIDTHVDVWAIQWPNDYIPISF